jgi:hypothetical protein
MVRLVLRQDKLDTASDRIESGLSRSWEKLAETVSGVDPATKQSKSNSILGILRSSWTLEDSAGIKVINSQNITVEYPDKQESRMVDAVIHFETSDDIYR